MEPSGGTTETPGRESNSSSSVTPPAGLGKTGVARMEDGGMGGVESPCLASCMSTRHVADTHADGQADNKRPPSLTFKGDPPLLCGTRGGREEKE